MSKRWDVSFCSFNAFYKRCMDKRRWSELVKYNLIIGGFDYGANFVFVTYYTYLSPSSLMMLFLESAAGTTISDRRISCRF